jgi:hypothetical protein
VKVLTEGETCPPHFDVLQQPQILDLVQHTLFVERFL